MLDRRYLKLLLYQAWIHLGCSSALLSSLAWVSSLKALVVLSRRSASLLILFFSLVIQEIPFVSLMLTMTLSPVLIFISWSNCPFKKDVEEGL